MNHTNPMDVTDHGYSKQSVLGELIGGLLYLII